VRWGSLSLSPAALSTSIQDGVFQVVEYVPIVISGLSPCVEYIYVAPGRFAGTKELPLIPNEVYFDIFDYIEPSDLMSVSEYKRILSNLTLVCRFFCAVLLPRIFKSLTFSGRPHRKSDTPGYPSFCRALIRGKEPACSLALHVRECTFSQWDCYANRLQRVFNGFLRIYHPPIARMLNLESLVLSCMSVSKKLIQAMSKLTRLKALVMYNCYVNKDICKLSSLKLVTLEFHGDWYIRELLELISPALRVFRTGEWDFARDFMTGTAQCHIEELEISLVEDVIVLRQFLERTPSIRKLKISHIYSAHATPLGLSPSSLPRLHSIDCPSSLILDFVCSRPLRRIALSGTHYIGRFWRIASLPPMTLEDIAIMTKSTAATRTLDIPAAIYFVVPMDYFPHLEKLRLDFMHRNYVRRFPDGPGFDVSYVCLDLSF